jgi:hypothetical protein
MANNFPKINTGDTSFDKIWAHFIDENTYKLSKKQEILKERWLAAWTLRLNFHSTEQAVKVHMEKYNVSRAQAFRDINNAERLFGNISKTDRAGKMAIWSEYCHKYYLMAVKQKDLKSVGKALDLLGKAYEVDRNDSAMHNPEKLENPTIKLSISKSSKELLSLALSKGVVDFNRLHVEDAQLIEDE